jgi:hypothetical protein
MKKPPPRIGVPDSASDITSEVLKLLKAAGVGDRVPTPKADILACAKLIETGELDLDEYREAFSDRIHGALKHAFSKVVGLLDFRRKVVYVASGMTPGRRNFIVYHEVSHRALPWQRSIYASDDELTLDPKCEEVFEAEANFGAAEILFQGDRFEMEVRDFPIGLQTVLFFAQRYDASCHATFRRLVERSDRPCSLLVLKRTVRTNENGEPSYFIVYSVESISFSHRFGDPFGSLRFLGPETEVARIVNSGLHGEIDLFELNGFKKRCNVESFDNRRHVFVLLWPQDIGKARFHFAMGD